MGLRINTNVFSIAAQKNLRAHTDRLSSSYNKLSTGLRITGAADDAAGLAISERLRAQTRGLEVAQRNANDGISMIQTAEGALDEVSSILVRMRELSVQASNGTLGNTDKNTLQEEFSNLKNEIGRIAGATTFNGINLTQTAGNNLTFQVGTGTGASDTIDVTFGSATTTDLGLTSLDIGSGGSASGAITAIDTAINSVASLRGNLGAAQNRLTSAISNIASTHENLSAAESRIRDVDVAKETANLTRNSILQQAALSILQQANVQPQSALSLLG
jgi:flagellin